MTTHMSVEEVMESLTGYDEIAMEKHMGIDVYTEAEAKPVVLMRALVFILLRRDGANDQDARKAVMEMPVKAVQDYFPEDQEVDAEDPVTDMGKGDSEPVELPPI